MQKQLNKSRGSSVVVGSGTVVVVVNIDVVDVVTGMVVIGVVAFFDGCVSDTACSTIINTKCLFIFVYTVVKKLKERPKEKFFKALILIFQLTCCGL